MPTQKAVLTSTEPAGIFEFDVWNGPIHRLSNEGSYYKRIGQQGSDNQILGRSAPPSQCTGVIFCTETVGNDLLNKLYNLKDTLVAFKDPFGRNFPKLWVKTIAAEPKAIDGVADFCLIVNMTLEFQP